MRWYTLLPAAIVAPMAATPAYAVVYLTAEQAQKLTFPEATGFVDASLKLTPDQKKAIKAKSGVSVRFEDQRIWEARNGETRLGWVILDRVFGKHEFITYVAALDAAGAVKQIEVVEYRESYGGEIRNPRWRAQFAGKRHGDTLKLDRDIKNISGATLSCRHVTDGVKRLLALHDVVLRNA